VRTRWSVHTKKRPSAATPGVLPPGMPSSWFSGGCSGVQLVGGRPPQSVLPWSRRGMATRGSARQGMAGHGGARLGNAGVAPARRGEAWLGAAWPGLARHGMADRAWRKRVCPPTRAPLPPGRGKLPNAVVRWAVFVSAAQIPHSFPGVSAARLRTAWRRSPGRR
jgi:hypothetical protein